MEAVRRLAAERALDDRALDEPLLDASPLTAGRVLYCGPHGETFRHGPQIRVWIAKNRNQVRHRSEGTPVPV